MPPLQPTPAPTHPRGRGRRHEIYNRANFNVLLVGRAGVGEHTLNPRLVSFPALATLSLGEHVDCKAEARSACGS